MDNSDQEQASDIDSNLESNEPDDDADSGSESDDDTPQRCKIDATKAKTKFHHVAKTLRATAKRTKTFEVQKLVKKLKGLQKKASLADQAASAEKELLALKFIDTAPLAGRALITKMVKAKLLPRPSELENADGEEYLYLQMVKDEELLGMAVLSDPVAAGGDKALERAKAKITSSKVLADEVGKFVDELKKLAGIEPVSKKGVEVDVKGKGKAKQEQEQEEREWSGSEESDEEEDAPRRLPMVDDEDGEEEDEEDADEEELIRIGREKMKALGDLSQWDDMIGSDSGAESESESEVQAPAKQKRKGRHESVESSDDDGSDDDDSDASSSNSDSDSDSDSSSSTTRPRKRKSTTASSSSKPTKKPKSSTFLPTLSTGFIAGRSDDEWSDAEADLADRDLSELRTGAKKERKNRMGQRARKALYEKKYGSNANHIKMREKQKQARLERASAATAGGAVRGGRQRPPAFQAPTKKDGGWGGPVAPLPKQPRVFRPQPEVPVQEGGRNGGQKPAAAAKSQEMHPSWIAKQKQKELMAQVKPQGKKVVFD